MGDAAGCEGLNIARGLLSVVKEGIDFSEDVLEAGEDVFSAVFGEEVGWKFDRRLVQGLQDAIAIVLGGVAGDFLAVEAGVEVVGEAVVDAGKNMTTTGHGF